jgi:hypothetical protein
MDRRGFAAASIVALATLESSSVQTPGGEDDAVEMLRLYVDIAQGTGDVSVLDDILHPDVFDPNDVRTLPGIGPFKQGILDGYYNRQDAAWESFGPTLQSAISADNSVAGVALWTGRAGSNLPEFSVPYIYFIKLKDGLLYEVNRSASWDSYEMSLQGG